jgi:aminoglycoside 6'-N-acetyltransferase
VVPAFAFRRMLESDLPRMQRWLAEPHVRAFWTDELHTLEAVTAHYLPRIVGADKSHPFLALAGDAAIGYLQTYLIDDHPDYAAQVDVGPSSAGVDMLIGEPGFAHRGLGGPLLRQFVDEIVWQVTGARTCWIGPAVDNPRAIRAYEKAGFVHVKTVAIAGEAVPEYLMMLPRPRP